MVYVSSSHNWCCSFVLSGLVQFLSTAILGLRGSVSFRYLLVSPWEILNTLSLTWDPLLTLFSYQAGNIFQWALYCLTKNKSENHHVKVLTFFSIDQSLSEENFGLFCTQDQLSFSSHQKYYRGRSGNRMEELCVAVLYIFEITPFIGKKILSPSSLSRHLVIRCDILCWCV